MNIRKVVRLVDRWVLFQVSRRKQERSKFWVSTGLPVRPELSLLWCERGNGSKFHILQDLIARCFSPKVTVCLANQRTTIINSFNFAKSAPRGVLTHVFSGHHRGCKFMWIVLLIFTRFSPNRRSTVSASSIWVLWTNYASLHIRLVFDPDRELSTDRISMFTQLDLFHRTQVSLTLSVLWGIRITKKFSSTLVCVMTEQDRCW